MTTFTLNRNHTGGHMPEPGPYTRGKFMSALIDANPDLKARLQDAFANAQRLIEAYEKLTLEQELELWKSADHG